jgi:para-aminobenzoate synthetase/4-amino-4-deoxychorismate lyase
VIGLFETMLVPVRDAELVPPLLPYHLERLAHGLRSAFGVPLDLGTVRAALAAATLRGTSTHIVRLECRVTDGAAVLVARPREFAPVTVPLRWLPFTLTAAEQPPTPWLKSLTREFWEEHERAIAGSDGEPLAIDPDGLVLESSRGNVLALVDGEFVTPPLDGRILPGIGRASLLRGLRARGHRVAERPLHIRELATASSWSTNAVRGARAAVLEGASESRDLRVGDLLEDIWRRQTCAVPRHSRRIGPGAGSPD